jgi:hypothetical protein
MVERVLIVAAAAGDAETGTYLSRYALESNDVMLSSASRRVRNAAAAVAAAGPGPGLESGGEGRGG